jgi:hypothetical protein
MAEDSMDLPHHEIGKRVWVRRSAGSVTLDPAIVVSVWRESLSGETMLTVRLCDGSVMSFLFAQRGDMWDFAPHEGS